VGTASTPYPLFKGHAYYFLTHIETFEQSWAFGSGFGFVSSTVNLTVNHWELDIVNPYLGGGGGCVLAGTMVSTSAERSQPIETIRAGQKVLGWDPARKAFVRETVLRNTHTNVDRVEVINDGLLVVTVTDQPLYVSRGSWEGWVRDPGRLSAGEYLFHPVTGKWIEITSIQAVTGRFKVYDLVVTSPNDYIANGILVLDKF
jgi:hypothetical protein